MATAGADRVKKTVTFTQSDADQVLLKAVEVALSQEQYGSFGELCKQALKQFLGGRKSQAAAPNLLKFAQQLIDLQRQFFDFKEASAAQAASQFEHLESQIADLQQPLQQLEVRLDQTSASPTPEPEQPAAVAIAESAVKSDPLLNRLGSLLEDF